MVGRAVVVGALVACACVVAAHAGGSPPQGPARQLLVGLDDDTAKWRSRPDRLLATYCHLGVDAVRLTIPWRRGHYARFLKHVLTRIPTIRDVVVWNEANSPEFWPAEGGAAAYEELLAACWDRLRGLRPYVNLISSTAAKHDRPASSSTWGPRTARAGGRSRS